MTRLKLAELTSGVGAVVWASGHPRRPFWPLAVYSDGELEAARERRRSGRPDRAIHIGQRVRAGLRCREDQCDRWAPRIGEGLRRARAIFRRRSDSWRH